MERDYICTGCGVTYIIPANSATAARVKAGSRYKTGTKGPYPAGFYAEMFDVRLQDSVRPGPKTVRPELEGEAVGKETG